MDICICMQSCRLCGSCWRSSATTPGALCSSSATGKKRNATRTTNPHPQTLNLIPEPSFLICNPSSPSRRTRGRWTGEGKEGESRGVSPAAIGAATSSVCWRNPHPQPATTRRACHKLRPLDTADECVWHDYTATPQQGHQQAPSAGRVVPGLHSRPVHAHEPGVPVLAACGEARDAAGFFAREPA